MPVDESWFKYLKIDFSRPDAKVIHGFLKSSPDYSHTNKIWRLYLTLDFDDYIEFHEDDDYLGSVPVDSTQNSVRGTLVWLKASSKIRRVNTVSKRAQADFLRGEISSEYQGRTGMEALQVLSPLRPPTQTGAMCTQDTYCKC